MRNAFLIPAFCLLMASEAGAQHLSVSPSILSFDTTLTITSDTLWFTIQNQAPYAIQVDSLVCYNPDFEAIDNNLSVPGFGSVQTGVVFHPRHNIDYNSELVVYARAHQGNLAIDLHGTGKYPEAYYAPTQGLSEEALKQALKSLISGHTSLGYNLARDKMFMVIDNQRVNGQGASQNTIEGVYTGTVITGYTSRQDAFSNYNFNTEHTFPQGKFSGQEPMKSDLYHLFPTLVSANSERGSKPFGLVSNPTWQQGGSRSNATTFEPRPQHKGPAARAMLYFLVRYQNYGNFVSASDQDILRQWCLNYLPNAVEKKRNEDISALQHNRNPFIDHPEFVERIHSFISNSTAPTVRHLVITSDTISLGYGNPGDTLRFWLVMVNDGNATVTLTNAMLNGPGLSLLNFPASVPTGESGIATVQWVVTDTNAMSATLTFESNAQGQAQISVPVTGNSGSPTDVNPREYPAVRIWPVPARDMLFLSYGYTGRMDIAVYNFTGQRVYSTMVRQAEDIQIPLQSFPEGAYYLQWIMGDRMETKPFVIVR